MGCRHKVTGGRTPFLLVALLTLFISVVFSVASEEIKEKKNVTVMALQEMTLEKILAVKVINNDYGEKKKKAPVSFDHMSHQSVACMECHHQGQFEKCISCHDENAKTKIRLAFHKNCKNCHKDICKENKESTAPFRKCDGCHK